MREHCNPNDGRLKEEKVFAFVFLVEMKCEALVVFNVSKKSVRKG